MAESAVPKPSYALYVPSRHEKSVSEQLGAKPCEVFLPLDQAKVGGSVEDGLSSVISWLRFLPR
jgi:hypothetical protein